MKSEDGVGYLENKKSLNAMNTICFANTPKVSVEPDEDFTRKLMSFGALDPHFVSSTGICIKSGKHPLEGMEILDATLKHEQPRSLEIVNSNHQVMDIKGSTKAIK